jgi:hypothetical protein
MVAIIQLLFCTGTLFFSGGGGTDGTEQRDLEDHRSKDRGCRCECRSNCHADRTGNRTPPGGVPPPALSWLATSLTKNSREGSREPQEKTFQGKVSSLSSDQQRKDTISLHLCLLQVSCGMVSPVLCSLALHASLRGDVRCILRAPFGSPRRRCDPGLQQRARRAPKAHLPSEVGAALHSPWCLRYLLPTVLTRAICSTDTNVQQTL